MNDNQLLLQFEDATIKPTCWDHRAHVKVAYLLLLRDGLVQAIASMSKGLQRFLQTNAIPTGPDQGFHETLTVAWLELIATAMAEAGPFDSADAFCDKQQHLLNKYALLFFYSRELLMSAAARQGFIEPDLAPLPRPRDPNAGCHQTHRKQAARVFAALAHGDQLYDDNPYTYHLDAVARILAPFGEEAVVIGYLHDVLEDTSVDKATLSQTFGAHTAHCVSLLTDITDAPRKERKKRSHQCLAAIDPDGPDAIALLVKTADRLANMCHSQRNAGMFRMYQKEYPAFCEATRRFPSERDLASRIRRQWLAKLWQQLDQYNQPGCTSNKA